MMNFDYTDNNKSAYGFGSLLYLESDTAALIGILRSPFDR
jgi:hypothetical protein